MLTSQLVIAAVPSGQGLRQMGELAIAFGLSALIGLEREWRQKAAGLRTYTLVGVGAAAFVIISKYGFSDVLGPNVILDPSRVSAAIVSGIGFIGGGLIFVRRDAVRGLTTAAIVWVTAAIGMACGAGLVVLALFATAMHFVIVFFYRWLAAVLPRSRYVGYGLRVTYEDGRGILRQILAQCTDRGFEIAQVATQQIEHDIGGKPAVGVELEVRGQPSAEGLTTSLEGLSGVLEVTTIDRATIAE
jgi:putative Mg2+ transporter-C (MgtC) family protein